MGSEVVYIYIDLFGSSLSDSVSGAWEAYTFICLRKQAS